MRRRTLNGAHTRGACEEGRNTRVHTRTNGGGVLGGPDVRQGRIRFCQHTGGLAVGDSLVDALAHRRVEFLGGTKVGAGLLTNSSQMQGPSSLRIEGLLDPQGDDLLDGILVLRSNLGLDRLLLGGSGGGEPRGFPMNDSFVVQLTTRISSRTFILHNEHQFFQDFGIFCPPYPPPACQRTVRSHTLNIHRLQCFGFFLSSLRE